MRTLPGIRSIVAAMLFAGVVAMHYNTDARNSYVVEMDASCSQAGSLQVFFDVGRGFSEAESRTLPVPRANTSIVCRFKIPSGEYKALRLDPSDGMERVVLARTAILDAHGRVVRRIGPVEFKAGSSIASLQVSGEQLLINLLSGGSDPQVVVDFSPPLVLPGTMSDRFFASKTRVMLLALAVLLVPILGVAGSAKMRRLLGRASTAAAVWPRTATLGTAVVATLLSAYPVVFLGKSYVSPDGGTTLLYGGFPTLPGYSSDGLLDTKGGDVGAVMWQHVGYAAIQRRSLGDGELPLWNRYASGGVPLLGQGQSMLGDPLHLIVVAADSAAWAWDLKYVIAKSIFAAGLGLLVWRLTGSVASAIIIAAAASFLGFFVYRINHPALFSVCYSPWILHGWLSLVRAKTFKDSALAGGLMFVSNLSVMSSGTIKEATALLLSLNGTGFLLLLFGHLSWRSRLEKIGCAIAALVLFAAATSPVWQTFRGSLRMAYTAYTDVPVAYQVQPALLLGALDEVFFRTLSRQGHVYNPSVNLLVALGLAWFVVTAFRRRQDRLAWAVALGALVPMLIVFGGIPSELLTRVPLLANVWHVDNCFLCVLLVHGCVLGGVGFHACLESVRLGEWRARAWQVGLLAGAVIFAWIGFHHAHQKPLLEGTFSGFSGDPTIRVPTFLWWHLAAAVVAGFLLLDSLGSLAIRGDSHGDTKVAVVLCMAVLLFRTGFHAGEIGSPDYVVHPTTRVDFSAASETVAFLQRAAAREPARVIGLGGNLHPGWGAVYGLEGMLGVDALSSGYLRELALAIDGWGLELQSSAARLIRVQRFLDAFNVRYYVDGRRTEKSFEPPVTRVFSRDLDVYESPTAWPRAFFTHAVETYDAPAELVRRIADGDGRPFCAVQRGEEGERVRSIFQPTPASGVRPVVPATDYELTENTTRFTLRADGAGVAVLTECHWPGDFRAWINGKKVPIVRVNHAFKGVVLPAAGEYRVEFKYLPRRFPILAGVSLAAFGLAAAVFLLAQRRPENRAAERASLAIRSDASRGRDPAAVTSPPRPAGHSPGE